MTISTDGTSQKVEARRVADGERITTLPRHFGRHMLTVEDSVYTFMRQLARDYSGSYWHFYELTNGGFYMAPGGPPLHISVDGNGFDGEMSADAAGITVCLFAFSHLSFAILNDTFSRHYYDLREFALEHAEASAIMGAID
jgi:hypothetical protein